ncbi:hypothetical protein D9M71_169390 [compost metagenome]
MHHLPGDGDFGCHIGQAKTHGLVLDDRLAERLALLGIVAGVFERGPCHTHRLRGNADTAAFQIGQGDAIALALLAQPVTGGDT